MTSSDLLVNCMLQLQQKQITVQRVREVLDVHRVKASLDFNRRNSHKLRTKRFSVEGTYLLRELDGRKFRSSITGNRLIRFPRELMRKEFIESVFDLVGEPSDDGDSSEGATILQAISSAPEQEFVERFNGWETGWLPPNYWEKQIEQLEAYSRVGFYGSEGSTSSRYTGSKAYLDLTVLQKHAGDQQIGVTGPQVICLQSSSCEDSMLELAEMLGLNALLFVCPSLAEGVINVSKT
ncbi:hypothetical protein CcCBS67573_g06439 [Chytriomyces confervae]|uniref:Uncharacterized protein n=1 Tax=Chytriomyces confervae TaxID=246404 RepID=A0A507F3C0_9FUNG|nr:hypothetical protein CcCBS67573_g06439 [Chytriomyces confervae]